MHETCDNGASLGRLSMLYVVIIKVETGVRKGVTNAVYKKKSHRSRTKDFHLRHIALL